MTTKFRLFSFIQAVLFLVYGHISIGQIQSEKQFTTLDHVYEPQIQTVQFYPVTGQSSNPLEYPVVYLQKYESLQLEFDELGDQYKNYNFKLVHCNHDWRPSILNDFEFLQDYNEFTVDDYEISLNTRTPYLHYNLTIPKVKVSGNYVVKVYRSGNQSDLILTRRFVVYDSKISITLDPKFALDPAKRYSHQQIDFSIHYGDFQIYNPKEMIKVVLRQNGRWDNAYYDLQPMFLREEDRLLDYHFYNNENVFPGLNEYRGFDIRSLRFRGQNMENISFSNDKASADVSTDQSRNQKNLSQWIDLNGRFVIENYETRRGSVEADYVDVHFALDLKEPPDGDVYLFGMFSDWEIKPGFKMISNDLKTRFKGSVKIKQGFYNYSYVVVKPGQRPDETFLEGSYNQTENRYDILVYFRPVGGRYDQVLGYAEIDYNKLR
jgi:hypothetical protein